MIMQAPIVKAQTEQPPKVSRATSNRVYNGWVRHRRNGPRNHTFGYRMRMIGIAVDGQAIDGGAKTDRKIEQCSWFGWRKPALLRFHRPDYLAGHPDLATAVRDQVEAKLGWRPRGRIQLITQLRTLGIAFNPVSFYVCFDTDGVAEAVLAEITNTPWVERCAYIVDLRERSSASFQKVFHVSPFHGMNQRYRWSFHISGSAVIIHMQNFEQDTVVFDATLALQGHAPTSRNLFDLAWRRPLAPLSTLAAIYWQALRLFLKRTPFYSHPDVSDGALVQTDHPASQPRLTPSPASSSRCLKGLS